MRFYCRLCRNVAELCDRREFLEADQGVTTEGIPKQADKIIVSTRQPFMCQLLTKVYVGTGIREEEGSN